MIPRSIILSFAVLFWMSCAVRGFVTAPSSNHPLATSRAKACDLSPLFLTTSDPEDDDYGYDEETARNPTEEVKRIKQEIEKAKEEGDMDTVMTLMGTLLALGGGYDSES